MATRRGSERPAILLDWFNVSYRTLYSIGFALLVVLAAGSWFTYQKFFYEGSPRAEARLAINQAEEALDKAGPMTRSPA